MPQHRSKIVGVLPQPPDRREGPDSLARTVCGSKLVLDLSLLPLEFLHDLLDQDRVDPGGDAAQLRVLIRLDVGQPRLEPCPSPEGLLATTPNEGLLVSLQGCQAVRTEELLIQDPNYLGLEAIVPDASLAAGALPIPVRVSHRRVGAYGGERGRMIAAISIGIIIIVAVIIAALAIIYFVLKGSPR
jgi:hypothetical protein